MFSHQKAEYLYDGTRRNAVPEVPSKKDASRIGVPEPFFFLASVLRG
jgi:hypothetical protein